MKSVKTEVFLSILNLILKTDKQTNETRTRTFQALIFTAVQEGNLSLPDGSCTLSTNYDYYT